MSTAFALYAPRWVVVTTLIVLACSVRKKVALIVLPVNAQFAANQGENTIRTAFALYVVGRVSHSRESSAPKFHCSFFKE